MPVSPGFQAFAVEQLAPLTPVEPRKMFGGVGLYGPAGVFAFLVDDRLFLKADDASRAAFEAAGMEPFRPYGDHRTMGYYAVGADVLEDRERLAPWVRAALDAADRAAAAKGPRRR